MEGIAKIVLMSSLILLIATAFSPILASLIEELNVIFNKYLDGFWQFSHEVSKILADSLWFKFLGLMFIVCVFIFKLK